MDKNLSEGKSSDIIVCPNCGTLNSIENNLCTKCKYTLKTWATYEEEIKFKNKSVETSETSKEKENNSTKPKEESNQNIIQNNDGAKQNEKPDILIGSLLILPLYIVVFVILISVLRININFNPYILLAILMYLPVFIGIILSYKYYGEEASKVFSFLIIVFIVIALFNFYSAYFVDHEGFDALTPFFGWIATSIIAKIIACAYYGSLVGKKKALKFFALYVIAIVLSGVLGFWA